MEVFRYLHIKLNRFKESCPRNENSGTASLFIVMKEGALYPPGGTARGDEEPGKAGYAGWGG